MCLSPQKGVPAATKSLYIICESLQHDCLISFLQNHLAKFKPMTQPSLFCGVLLRFLSNWYKLGSYGKKGHQLRKACLTRKLLPCCQGQILWQKELKEENVYFSSQLIQGYHRDTVHCGWEDPGRGEKEVHLGSKTPGSIPSDPLCRGSDSWRFHNCLSNIPSREVFK